MAGYGYRRIPSYGAFPGDGTVEERRAWAEKTAALPKVTPEMVMGSVSGLDGYNPRIAAASVRSYFNPLLSPSSGPETPFGGSQADRNVAPAQQATQQDEQARRQPDQGTYRGGLLGVYRDRWDDVKRHYNDDGLLGGIGSGMRNLGGGVLDTFTAPYSAGLDALTSEPAKAFYRGITGKERPAPAASPTSPQRQAGTTGQSPQVQQSKAAGAAPSQPNQAAANAADQARASGAKEQRQHPGEARYGTYAAGPTWFDVEGSNGKVRVGYWDVDGRRQTLVRHGTFPEKSQAQPQQPRGLHYVPGGWANDGYSFEGSAEDRARFFAPVSGPGRAPRSDNDTFLMLQRQKAMQPVEQPLPERPEFPADRRMGWHTKLAKYQADMDAYNRQMANIAGYRQAMDVAALQQMPKPTDPVEQARLERALALQERQAAQQAAYQQAQLDQRDREIVQNYLNNMPERQVQAAKLGYQAMTNQAASDLLDAYRSGDQARIARAGAVWNALNNTSEKKGNADKREVREFEDENGDKVPVLVDLNTGEAKRINIDGLDARVKEAKQALLKDIGRYDQNNPEVKKLVAALESARTLEEVRAVQEGMKSIGK